MRLAQAIGRAVAIAPRPLGIAHPRVALDGHAGDSVAVELLAVEGMGQRPAMRVGTRSAEADDHRDHGELRTLRRLAAPCAGMAAIAGEAVEERTEAVEPGMRAGRRGPVGLEELPPQAITLDERAAQLGEGLAERIDRVVRRLERTREERREEKGGGSGGEKARGQSSSCSDMSAVLPPCAVVLTESVRSTAKRWR